VHTAGVTDSVRCSGGYWWVSGWTVLDRKYGMIEGEQVGQ
jgi:hypothetical protein